MDFSKIRTKNTKSAIIGVDYGEPGIASYSTVTTNCVNPCGEIPLGPPASIQERHDAIQKEIAKKENEWLNKGGSIKEELSTFVSPEYVAKMKYPTLQDMVDALKEIGFPNLDERIVQDPISATQYILKMPPPYPPCIAYLGLIKP